MAPIIARIAALLAVSGRHQANAQNKSREKRLISEKNSRSHTQKKCSASPVRVSREKFSCHTQHKQAGRSEQRASGTNVGASCAKHNHMLLTFAPLSAVDLHTIRDSIFFPQQRQLNFSFLFDRHG
jgi:hypothetical protein